MSLVDALVMAEIAAALGSEFSRNDRDYASWLLVVGASVLLAAAFIAAGPLAFFGLATVSIVTVATLRAVFERHDRRLRGRDRAAGMPRRPDRSVSGDVRLSRRSRPHPHRR